MIAELFEEMQQTAREIPAFAVTFLLLVAMCVGVRCSVFYEANGDQVRLIADRDSMQEETADSVSRMQPRPECPMKGPGFTVIVGLRQYQLELSVPAASLRAMFESARMGIHSSSALKISGTA